MLPGNKQRTCAVKPGPGILWIFPDDFLPARHLPGKSARFFYPAVSIRNLPSPWERRESKIFLSTPCRHRFRCRSLQGYRGLSGIFPEPPFHGKGLFFLIEPIFNSLRGNRHWVLRMFRVRVYLRPSGCINGVILFLYNAVGCVLDCGLFKKDELTHWILMRSANRTRIWIFTKK